MDQDLYQKKVWDQARVLASECRQDTSAMSQRLTELGATPEAIAKVNAEQRSPEYEEQLFGGVSLDEAVYEETKEALRPIYGF